MKHEPSPESSVLKIYRTATLDADFLELVRLLDLDLRVRDGDDHPFYAQFNTLQGIHHVVVARDRDTAVGCGAFKAYDQTTAEIKRMFVRPEHRGKGIGLAVLAELERWCRELGYGACMLETGRKQPEAIRLYEKAGYLLIPNYAQYAGVENSVCMKKSLS